MVNRDEILAKLDHIEGSTHHILIFDNISDQASNKYFKKEERIVTLIRIKDSYSKIIPEANGRYALTLWRPRQWTQKGPIKRRTRYTIPQKTYELLISYIDDLISALRPRNQEPVLTFRDALLIDRKEDFIKAVKPHLKEKKYFALLYFALLETSTIVNMVKKEAHLMLTAEFGNIGSYQYFNPLMNTLHESKSQSNMIGEEDRRRIDRFRSIIERHLN